MVSVVSIPTYFPNSYVVGPSYPFVGSGGGEKSDPLYEGQGFPCSHFRGQSELVPLRNDLDSRYAQQINSKARSSHDGGVSGER